MNWSKVFPQNPIHARPLADHVPTGSGFSIIIITSTPSWEPSQNLSKSQASVNPTPARQLISDLSSGPWPIRGCCPRGRWQAGGPQRKQEPSGVSWESGPCQEANCGLLLSCCCSCGVHRVSTSR